MNLIIVIISIINIGREETKIKVSKSAYELSFK